MTTTKSRSYWVLQQHRTFQARFDYLALRGGVGVRTFGSERYLNQGFYKSREWRHIRHEVIARDNACDLGVPGYEIFDQIYIHHINPITVDDIETSSPQLFDLDNLISVSHRTHNAIHYGVEEGFYPHSGPIVRKPNDTTLW